MGQSVVKNSKKIFSQPGSDPSLNNRVTNLEDNVYKITYYEIVSGTSGSLTIPTGATINEGEFGTSGNSILSKINVEDKPTYSSPLTSGNVVVTANLNIDGTWTASGTYTDTQVALVYSVNIKAIDYHNLDNFYVINSEKLISDSVIAGFVPYTGATTNVDLGEFGLSAGQINLDTSPSGTAIVGSTRWNNTNGTSETLLKGGSVSLKNGVDLVTRVVNKAVPNQTLTKAQYQVVKVVGATGGRLSVDLAQANNDLNSADTLGVVIETIATNQEGFIMTVGQLTGINTTGSLQGETWADGDVLYLSPTTPGGMTKVKPNGSTGHIVVLGYVEYSHAVNGKIYVKIMNGWELEELHDVYIPTYVNNGVLYRDTSTNLWKTNTIPSVLGYTPANDSNVVHLTGTESIGGLKTFTSRVDVSEGVYTYGSSKSAFIGLNTDVVNGNYPGIWFNQNATRTVTNYSFLSDTAGSIFNAQITGSLSFRIANSNKFRISENINDIIYLLTPSNVSGNTASVELPIFKISSATKTFSSGALTTQRFNYFQSQTIAFDLSSTVTNAYGLYVEASTAGSNATITNNYALGLKGKLELDLDGTGKFLRFTDWATPYSTYGWGIFTSVDKIRLPNTIYIGDSSYYINRFDAIGDTGGLYGGAFNTYKDFKAGSALNARIFIYGEDATGNVSTGAIVNANQRRFRVNQDTAWVDIGSMPTSTNTGAIYFNQTAPSGGGNSALSGNSSTTALNATSVVNVNTLGITRLRVISPQTTGSYIGFEFTTPTFTGQTASTNTPNLKVVGANKQWLPSTITDQYWNYFTANTAEFLTTASTITNSYGLFVEAATAGTNASITNNYALGTNGNVEFKSNTSTKIRILSGAGVDTYVGSEGVGAAFGSISAHNVVFYRGNSIKLTLQSSDFLFSDAYNISFNTTTGTKIGTSTTQKLGFYNATPIVRPSAVTTTQGIADTLTNLGLLESSTIQPLVGLIPDLKGHEVFRGVKFRPNSTTIDTEGGITNNLSGTQGANTVAITNYRTRQITMRFEPSTTTTGNYCCMRTSAALWSVTGGFLFTAEFGISDSSFTIGAHNFWGLTSSIANLAIGTISNLQPSALTNIIAVANDSGDANLQIMHNDATGTATKIDLGVDFPSNRTVGAVSTTMYHIRLYNAPGSTEVAYIVINKETGAIAEGVITTNLPDSSTLLAYQAGRSMGTGGGGVNGGGRFDVKLLGVYNI